MTDAPVTAPERPSVPVTLHGTAMARRFGWLYFLTGLWIFLRRLRLTDASAEHVRRAAEQGPVVYALRTQSATDFIALWKVLNRRRLPLAGLANGPSTIPWMPGADAAVLLKEKLAWFFRRGRVGNPVETGELTRHVASGAHAAVFLKPHPDWRDIFRPPAWPDPMAALLQAQAQSSRPIQVLPTVVVWRRAPEQAHGAIWKRFVGTEEEPGTLAKLLGLTLGGRKALVQVGPPVDLAEYLARFGDEAPERQAKRLRLMVRRYCFREAQVVRGPRQKSHRWLRRLVLRSAPMRTLIDQEALATGRSHEDLQRQLVKMYDRMAARLSYLGVSSFAAFCRFTWRNLYAGVDVRDEDLERLRQASREGVSVLTPCHRSHMDYMLLSSMMFENDIIVPYIVAGDNLAFFPFGWYFRRSGAFFIKRSFKGERLFPVLFQTYMTHLMREGYTLEFFIEGGRSRTGKLLPPKLGVLGNTVEAGIEARLGRSLGEVSYLPIAVSYEQVVEERPYARELGGEPKRKESLAGVVKAGGVFFKRYGRVYLRVGEPIRLSEFVAGLPAPWAQLDREHRREALQGLGERILHAIDRQAVVLPTGLVALALLCRSVPAHPSKTLWTRVDWIDAFLRREGAEFSTSLTHREPAVREALARFLSEGLVERIEAAEDAVFRVEGSRRITLEYYKNQLLHFFVPASLLAAVIRGQDSDRVGPTELTADFRLQLFLFRYEFVFDPNVDDETLERRALDQLVAAGALTALSDGGFMVLDPDRLDEVAGLTDTFREGYGAVLTTLPSLRNQDFDRDDLARTVQKSSQRLLEAQSILRPESLSLANLRNALRAFQEDGLYRLRAGSGGLELDDGIQQELVDRLRPLGSARP